jgi:hypothetical protein
MKPEVLRKVRVCFDHHYTEGPADLVEAADELPVKQGRDFVLMSPSEVL